MKKQKIIFFSLALIILAISILIISISYYIYSKGNTCVSDPFVYGANELKEKSGDDFICSCVPPMNSIYGKFYFDSKGVYETDPFGYFIPIE